MKKTRTLLLFISTLMSLWLVSFICRYFYYEPRSAFVRQWLLVYAHSGDANVNQATGQQLTSFEKSLVEAARERTSHQVQYDPRYVEISYPGGDVPPDKGVCTDVIIRSYRSLGIDLQHLVHRDMKQNFSLYPALWGLKQPDPNIDHRRVPNLMTFFGRHGTVLPISYEPNDYRPGDIVAWEFFDGQLHIGIVIDERTSDGKRWKVVHNDGFGPRIDDALFGFASKIIGHFRYEDPRRRRRTVDS